MLRKSKRICATDCTASRTFSNTRQARIEIDELERAAEPEPGAMRRAHAG